MFLLFSVLNGDNIKDDPMGYNRSAGGHEADKIGHIRGWSSYIVNYSNEQEWARALFWMLLLNTKHTVGVKIFYNRLNAYIWLKCFKM